MHRGEIYWTDFDPAEGSEPSKRRPAVVVSNDRALEWVTRNHAGTVTVVPVTSNTATVHPFQTFLPAGRTGLNTDSKAQAELVRTVACHRLRRALGRVPPELMAHLDDALRLHLDL